MIEAGVDRGLGAALVCRALARNAAEGHGGSYLGIEHDASKPIVLYERSRDRTGRIVRGDSLAAIADEGGPVDLFIHDTVPAPAHLAAQLDAARRIMSPRGVLSSTWTTPVLIEHALQHGLRLLTHQEEPRDHWFPGDRVAFLAGYGATPHRGA